MQKKRSLVLSFALVCSFWGCAVRKPVPVSTLSPLKVGISTVKYFDILRNRPLITEIWYPIDEDEDADPVAGMWVRSSEARDAAVRRGGKPYPLIVFSHGNGGDRTNIAWLAEILSSQGFIVAAVDHHGNTWNNKIAENFLHIWERPKDISFAINQVLQDSRFGPYIDSKKIGFVGYSLGGHTGIWIAGGRGRPFTTEVMKEIPEGQIPPIVTPEILSRTDFSPIEHFYGDHRVRAVFLMAPALIQLFDPDSLSKIQIPMHVVASEGDVVIPHTTALVLKERVAKIVCKIIPGLGNHYIFINEPTQVGKMLLDKTFVIDPPLVDRRHIHEEIGEMAVQFFKENL